MCLCLSVPEREQKLCGYTAIDLKGQLFENVYLLSLISLPSMPVSHCISEKKTCENVFAFIWCHKRTQRLIPWIHWLFCTCGGEFKLFFLSPKIHADSFTGWSTATVNLMSLMQQHTDEELSLISAYVCEHLLQTSAFILFCLNATTAVRVQKLINLQRTVALSTFIQPGNSALSQRSWSPAHTVITVQLLLDWDYCHSNQVWNLPGFLQDLWIMDLWV